MSTTHPAETLSLALVGLNAHVVRIDATIDSSTSFQILGLSDTRARETRVRVRSALQQVGVTGHPLNLTIRVGSEELAKSSALDLPIAVAALGALGHVSLETLKNTVILGELSLMGAVRPVRGVLPGLRGAVQQGVRCAIVPTYNAREAANVAGLRVLVAGTLEDVVRHLRDGVPLESPEAPLPFSPSSPTADMADIRGMHGACRALEIAAAGGYHLLLIGHPGAGKTMLARRLAGILPPITEAEALEVTAVHSVAGLLSPEVGILGTRPFRAPHHTVSTAGLVGGGDALRPGEVSLAHRGVLFLDEILEFRREGLDALRLSVEEGVTTVSRGGQRAYFPARTLFVGATSPCPCGLLGDPRGRCSCSPERVRSYLARLDGPFLDRFDLRVVLPRFDVSELRTAAGETSSQVQNRVVRARGHQAERLGKPARANAKPTTGEFERFDPSGLTARERGCLLRVARTIADLAGGVEVRAREVEEALSYVRPPTSLWPSP